MLDDQIESNTGRSTAVSNPLAGAFSYGLCSAAAAATGAAIRGNPVHNEAMTILVGGAITGAIAGSLGCCIPNTNASSHIVLQLCSAIFDTGLQAAALLAAPKMGELVLGLNVPWGQVIVDELVGTATFVGGVAIVGYGVYKGAQHCCSSSFFTPASPQSAIQLPVGDIEAPISTQAIVVNSL